MKIELRCSRCFTKVLNGKECPKCNGTEFIKNEVIVERRLNEYMC